MRKLPFPLLIKASAGGGGTKMRAVERAADFFIDALDAARREARAAFGDDAVLLRTADPAPRPAEIQVLADTHGSCVHLFERELLDPAPPPRRSSRVASCGAELELRAEMGAGGAAGAGGRATTTAGTVEFMLDAEGRYYFLEMNTRLQVEHPVTELVAGVDLVQLRSRWQPTSGCRLRRPTWRSAPLRSRCASAPRTRPAVCLPPGLSRCLRRPQGRASATTPGSPAATRSRSTTIR